ncbi:hypothetical protein TL16_g08534 [Triparma laevis f. inornata]|uniref:Uncharacterized protein n=1 Tax=Triparma laevis f. inornata TaxID=1714386 RepID=A0A9W7B6B5_9STRA|nr:hypothetical protein TL16_g08534 [Triparma laevis f. inornata]
MDTLMDVLSTDMILNHPEYKFKNSYNPTSPTLSHTSTPSPSRPNTSQSAQSGRSGGSKHSRGSSRSHKEVALTPREYLEVFEKDLPNPSSVINPDGTLDYTKYVGDRTKEQVAEGVREWAKYAGGPPSDAELPFSRCVVCTLPFGSCEHTRDWMNYKSPASRMQKERDVVDSTLFDMEDVLEVGSEGLNEELNKGIRTVSLPLTHISHMHWTEVVCRESDNIEGRKIDLSSPPCQGGASGVMIPNAVGQPHLIVHGGIRYPRNGVFHAYSSTLIGSKQEAVYEDRVFVYSMVEMTWHVPHHEGAVEDKPKGRYGHCAVVFPDRTMWTFGGRQKTGICSDDVHIWDFDSANWRKIEYDRNIVRVPPPRFCASATFVPEEGRQGSVVVFGGRDGHDNFGDLWIYDVATTDWSNPVCIGIPPSPRHGHSVIGLDGGRVMVLGGCCVSPSAETGIPENIDELDDKMQAASNRLEQCYALEKAEAEAAGLVLESEADYIGWKELARLGAQAAAAVAKRERDTRDAENDLNATLQERAAAMHWAKMNANHGRAYVGGVHDHQYMDITLLDVQSKVWTEPTAPPCTGKLPLARMNHSAVNLAGNIIVIGGCHPTSTRVTLSDSDVHVLDIESWRWTIPAVENTPFAMLPTLDAAKNAVRRANRVLEDEIGTAQSMGVPGGRSIEVAEAEAVLSVCNWRLKSLQEQCKMLRDPPPGRYGHTAVAMGQRIYFVGGYEADRSVGSGDEMVVLDLEQSDERERRLREEFHARLERERRIKDFLDEQARKQAEYEDRIRREREQKKERQERKQMEFEDMLSRLPPKTFAPTPQFKFANKHTIWLKWEQVKKNSEGNWIGAGRVVYRLFKKGGYQHLERGSKVLVQYVEVEGGSKKGMKMKGSMKESQSSILGGGGGSSIGGGSASFDDNASIGSSSMMSSSLMASSVDQRSQVGGWYPADVKKAHKEGMFDVHYNGGGKEKKVDRARIKLVEEPEWELIYEGKDLSYAVEASVPDVILEREPGIQIEMSFCMQTVGTEYPIEEPSLHSLQATYSTINRDATVEAFMSQIKSKATDDSDSVSRGKKKIKEAIEIDGHLVESWYNGKLVEGEGYGKHYV